MILLQKSQIIQAFFFPVAFVLIVILWGANWAFAIKPQPPLLLHLSTISRANNNIEVTLEVLANMDIESTQLSLHFPESLALVEGEEEWTGSIPLGQKKRLTILLQAISSTPEKVIGKATVHLPEGGSFDQQSTIEINAKKATPSISPSPPTQRRQGDETILEFRGK
jgi:hypothetical protein